MYSASVVEHWYIIVTIPSTLDDFHHSNCAWSVHAVYHDIVCALDHIYMHTRVQCVAT